LPLSPARNHGIRPLEYLVAGTARFLFFCSLHSSLNYEAASIAEDTPFRAQYADHSSSQRCPNANIRRLFNNPLQSDVKILQTVNGVTKEYNAHKSILMNQSEWFFRAFNGRYKV
jgi:hypothetical protein